jgi:hypothetical protein
VSITPKLIAERLIGIIEERHDLQQVDAVAIIKAEFDSEFIRESSSGGSSIDRRVLHAMKTLSDEIEWVQTGKLWRIKS